MSDFHHSPRQMLNYICNLQPQSCSLSSASMPSVVPPSVSTSSQPAPPIRPKAQTRTGSTPSNQLTLSEKESQFTFTSVLPSRIAQEIDPALDHKPEQKLIALMSNILQQGRTCRSCNSKILSTLQVSLDKLHYYCPTCCEIVSRMYESDGMRLELLWTLG